MCHRGRALAALITAILMFCSVSDATAENFIFQPSLTIEQRYDSNARFVDDSMRSDRSDIISTAAPQFVLKRSERRFNIDSLYRLEANYHSFNPELSHIAHWLIADIGIVASQKTKLFFGDTVHYTKDSLRVTENGATGDGLLVTRTDILSNTAHIGLRHNFTRKTDMELRLQDHIFEFDAAELIDTRTDKADISAGYRYSESGTGRLRYIFTYYTFDSAGSKDIKSHSLQLDFVERLSPTLSANIGGGATYIPELNGDSDYFIEGHAGLEKTYNDSVITLQYNRELTVPSGLVDEINLRDKVEAGITQTVSKTLTTFVNAGFIRNKTEPTGRVDVNAYAVEAEALWLPYQWLQLGVGVDYYKQWRDDDNIGTNLTRSQVYINLTFISDEWRF